MSSSDSFVSIRRPAGFPWCSTPRTTASAKRRALALSSGVSDVLTKPAEAAEVLRVVGRVLSGESATEMPPDAPPLTTEFDREHLRLLTDKLSEKAGDLRTANARLRALINIGLELASERDSDRLLEQRVRGRARSVRRDVRHARHRRSGRPNGAAFRHAMDAERRRLDQDRRRGLGDPRDGRRRAADAAWRQSRRRSRQTAAPGRSIPEVQAFLAAPIASPAHVYGWICLVGNEGRTFTEDDEQLVMALSGQVGRIYELEHEILERKQAESALRHERDRAQRYLDTAEVILLALDLDGRITLINRKGCDLLGWTEPELLGRDWIETCLPARIRGELRQKFHDAARRRSVRRREPGPHQVGRGTADRMAQHAAAR